MSVFKSLPIGLLKSFQIDFRAGFSYGLRRYWYGEGFPTFQRIFQDDRLFIQNLNFTSLIAKHEGAVVGQKSKGNLNFPRNDKKNPWHAVDLEQLIIEFTRNPKILHDPHFTNFVSEKSLSPCHNYYNLIVKQEFLAEELGFLTTHLKMNLTTEKISDFHHSNRIITGLEALQKHVHLYLDPITVQTREKLFNYFKNDLDIFGYTWNYKTNEITL